jgi:ADP-ribose pyrophosphatase YjhB (NUDIX family)
MFNYCPSCGSRDIYFDNIKKFRCKACDFTFFQNVAAAAAAILEYDGKIIAIKRGQEPQKGKLDLPGGFLDPEERAEDGLKREIKEELKIELVELKYLGSYPNIYRYKGVLYHTCDLLFYSKIDTLPADFNRNEIEELVLIDLKKIPVDEFAFESTKIGLELFKQNIE